jgi:hypothetical protein
VNLVKLKSMEGLLRHVLAIFAQQGAGISHNDKENVMVAAGIIRPKFECYGHHRHFSLPPSRVIGPVMVEFAEAKNLGNLNRNTTHEGDCHEKGAFCHSGRNDVRRGFSSLRGVPCGRRRVGPWPLSDGE